MRRKTTISASVLIIVTLIGIFFVVFTTFGQPASSSAVQVGRYSVAVDGENAYLVDTMTGCVWRKTAQLPFTLMAVEGLLEVPPHPKDKADAVREIPEKCR